MDEASSFDPQICRQCRGLCCQGHPGSWADPERFFRLFFPARRPAPEELRPLLAALQLELRDYSGVPVPAPGFTEAGCRFWGETGCLLPPERRPCQCLALIPSFDTLIDGEIRCQLPGPFSYGQVRSRWQDYWAGSAQETLSTTQNRSSK